MIRVQATKDGTYAGHYWEGPVDSDQGHKPGDVFDIDEKPYAIKDEQGNPLQDMEPTGQVDEKGNKTFRLAWIMEGGKIKKDAHGQPIPKLRMASFFSSEWMVRVADDTPLTYPDREPYRLPEPYRAKKQQAPATKVALPVEQPVSPI